MGTRQLAIVVFADIVGYTALMQRDETGAARARHMFRKVIDGCVGRFGGRVIQYYGDGCLSVFNSGKLAVQFAMECQSAFAPADIPVRIGMHLGDVTIDDDGAYGDAVNIAARVESFAVPGGVFMSKKVRDQISNHAEIESTSLGRFELKNVTDPIEIFAISNEGFTLPDGRLEGKGEKELNSVAVLAFTNMSNDPEQEFFGDGIAEEIINELVKLPDLKVAGRTSSFSFKGREMDLREIGLQLGVKNVLEGSIRKAGNRIRVTAQLIKTDDGFHLWSERYDRELEDIFAIQDDIAVKIANKLKVTLLSKPEPLANAPTANLEAYEWYLRGRHLLDERTNVLQARKCFEQARRIDPAYARAWSGLAYTYFYGIFFGGESPKSMWTQAKECAARAQSLDPNLAESLLMQGLAAFYFEWDINRARRIYERAVELAPQSFDVYRVKAYFHCMLREEEAAMANLSRCMDIDPLNVNVRVSQGEILYRFRQYDEAVEVIKSFLEDYPNSDTAHFLLAACYFQLGNSEAMLRNIDRGLQLIRSAAFYALTLPSMCIRMGMPEKAKELQAAIERKYAGTWTSRTPGSLTHYSLGKTDQAEQALELALEERDPVLFVMNVDPAWDAYRQEPGMRNAFTKIGLGIK